MYKERNRSKLEIEEEAKSILADHLKMIKRKILDEEEEEENNDDDDTPRELDTNDFKDKKILKCLTEMIDHLIKKLLGDDTDDEDENTEDSEAEESEENEGDDESNRGEIMR